MKNLAFSVGVVVLGIVGLCALIAGYWMTAVALFSSDSFVESLISYAKALVCFAIFAISLAAIAWDEERQRKYLHNRRKP